MKTAILLGILAAPAAAFAHPVGGGGGGGGGVIVGGSVSPGTLAPTPTTTSASPNIVIDSVDVPVYHRDSACVDGTDVVGVRECTPFGAWSQNLRFPSVFLDAGLHVRRMPVMVYGAGTAQRTDAMAAASELRIGLDLPHGLYVAAEGELGSATAPDGSLAAMRVDGEMSLGDASDMFLGGYAVVGARFATHRGLLALEGAGGGRLVTGVISDASSGVLEARARAELWVGPWVTVGGTVGTSVVDRGDWMTGLYVGVHSRAYAGTR